VIRDDDDLLRLGHWSLAHDGKGCYVRKRFAGTLKSEVMKSCLTIALLLALSFFCQGQSQMTTETDFSSADWQVDSTREVSYRVIDVGYGEFGYDVLINGKIYIHQTTVPAVPGIRAFARKEDAVKVARLVVTKIEQGVMPPAVTKAEIEALGWRDH